MATVSKKKYFEGRGSRKRSAARVRIYDGNETSVINGVPVEEFYKSDEKLATSIMRPIIVAGMADKVHFSAKVSGGGLTGQHDAIILGLARALVKKDESVKESLKKEDFLSRDAREKERKKYFHIKARKKPQFSKR